MDNNFKSSTTYSFPRVDIPKGQKDEAWHKQAILAIIHNSINKEYEVNYAQMDESVNFFQGVQGGDEFNFVQSAEDGEVLPANWITFNKIKTKIEILLGELQTKGYRIDAVSINKDAKVRKLKAKEKARVNMQLQPARELLEQSVGMPLDADGFVPQDEQELDSFFKYSYKEKNEIIMEYALRWLAKKFKWSYTRLAAYRDLYIMGKTFYEVKLQDGLPSIRRIDPRYMVYDTAATDDFLSNSTYYGEIEYMSIADCAAKYNLSVDEIAEVYSKWSSFTRAPRGSNRNLPSPLSGYDTQAFNALRSSQLNYFKGSGSTLRVLVFNCFTLFESIRAESI